MDIGLQNAYVEVLLDNFMSVVKQNVMFQAQLELNNKKTTEYDEMKVSLQDLINKNLELQQKVSSLTEDLNSTKSTAIDNKDIAYALEETRKEKERLQNAANDYMRQIRNTQDSLSNANVNIDKLKNTIEEQNKYIEQLESIIPVTKLKKIKLDNLQEENIKNGGTF